MFVTVLTLAPVLPAALDLPLFPSPSSYFLSLPLAQALPSVINAALLTSAWSAASSDMYTASRTLYGLALQGNAPRILARTTSWGVPWGGIIVGSAFALLAYMAAGAGQAGEVRRPRAVRPLARTDGSSC